MMNNLVNIEDNIENKKKGSKQLANEMSQSIDLFRKYLLTKSENHNVGKTNKEEESEVLSKKKTTPPPPPRRALIPLMPLKFHSINILSRPPSLLELQLFPGIRCEAIGTSSSPCDEKSSKAQLTIFYAGVVNVYDNVPTDKAQAIMLLAGENSLSKPTANENPKPEINTPLIHPPNIESSCKLKADFPIARKISLQHFLAKRRRRIVTSSPYGAAANYRDITKKDVNELKLDNNNNNSSMSLSPFPSRLGCHA